MSEVGGQAGGAGATDSAAEVAAYRACIAELRDQLARARAAGGGLARIMVDEMYQFVAILDVAGVTLDINQSALVAVGATSNEVVGRPFWTTPWWTVSPELQRLVASLIERAASGEFVRTEVQHYGAGGRQELIDVDFSLKPVRGSSGQVEYLIAEGRDITEKKHAEAELSRKNQEIRRLFEKLKEFDRLKTEFFANVSHELRTPLALILGPTEKWLSNPALPPAMAGDLELIQRHARILLGLVNDLLEISKLEAGRMAVTHVRTDLARLVAEVAANFDAVAQHSGITYTSALPAELGAELDPEKVRRILLNLLSNAFKFTSSGGQIRVSASLDATAPASAVLEVADSGPGVPAEQRDRIFERFYQVEGGATRQIGGTGLGLAIAQELAALHGGTIRADVAPEGGALFRVRLPIAAPAGTLVERPGDDPLAGGPDAAVLALAGLAGSQQQRQPPEGAAPAPAPASQEFAAGERPLVLVVEDNPEMNRFIAEAMEARWRVATARDGAEGLERALTLKPDAIVTDVMMPRLGGDDLVIALRRHEDLDLIPILVLTAKADEAQRVALLRSGAQDYVEKPFVVAELVARVANWIAVSQARRILQRELQTRQLDLAMLASEAVQRKRELAVALDLMREARDQAQQASTAKTNFLNLVSHELRTPLSTLLLQLELLQATEAELPQSFRVPLQRINNATTRLQDLVSSLLEFSRLRSGRGPWPYAAVELSRLAADVLEALRPHAISKGLQLTLSAPATLPPLRSNQAILTVILNNLLGNAIKYTEHGAITVTLAHDGATQSIAVSDTGPGIPADQRARVFEPFEQLESVSHKHAPGFGLGLSIVQEMVAVLGGRIELRSVVGEGATFMVTLPTGLGG